MVYNIPAPNRYETNQPYEGKNGKRYAGYMQCNQRLWNPHIALLCQIEIVGKEPKHSAGAGADMISKERQRKDEDNII